MADREWFEVEGEPYPNLEAAAEAAQELACSTSDEIEICHCTQTVVRRYRRQVTVVSEDVKPAS